MPPKALTHVNIYPVLCVSLIVVLALAGCGNLPDMRTADNALNQGDYQTARENYEQLSDFGLPAAKIALGKMYLHGDGVEVDPQRALVLFQEAEAAGDNRVAPRLIPKAQAKIEAFERRAARAQQRSHSGYQSHQKNPIKDKARAE